MKSLAEEAGKIMLANNEKTDSRFPSHDSLTCTLLPQERDVIFSEMLEKAPDGMFVLGLDEIFYANSSACSMLGYTPREIESKKPLDFILAQERERIQQQIETLLKSDGSLEKDLDLVCKNGFVLHCQAVINPSHKGKSRLLHGTIKRKYQRSFDPTLLDLSKNLANLGKAQRLEVSKIRESAATLAHEIRNSIMTVTGCVQLLENERKIGSLESEIMLEEMNRADRLLYEFLSFGRITYEHYEEMDINHLLERCMSILHGQLSHHQIHLIKQLDHSQPAQVMLHADKMKQAIINICQNAIEAMSPGGTLTVASQIEADRIHLSFNDNGRGIAPDSMDKIMQPFFTTRSTGTGLGLSVAQNIVHEHGGKISIQSEEGQGTTVTLTLPLLG